MEIPSRRRVVWLVLGLAVGLLFMGVLRMSAASQTFFTPLAGLATPGYVAVTVVFTILLVRAGLPLDGFGFGRRLDLRQIMLAVAAFTALRVFALVLNPLVEEIVGGPRNLERFSGVEGSVASLIALLAVNWTLAAFGEEFAYRILLMRGISFVLGDSGEARICAVAAQALPSSRILESLCRRHQSINFPSL